MVKTKALAAIANRLLAPVSLMVRLSDSNQPFLSLPFCVYLCLIKFNFIIWLILLKFEQV